MSSEWSRFISALEAKGKSFEKLRYASDPNIVISSLGIIDPVDAAVIETEWRLRIQKEDQTSNQTGASRNMFASKLTSDYTSSITPNDASGGNSRNFISKAAMNKYQENLALAPEEIQDSVLALETLGALTGRGGTFFIRRRMKDTDAYGGANRTPILDIETEGSYFKVTDAVPPAFRAAAQSIVDIADSYLSLKEVANMEIDGKSSVGMALGEVLSETCCAYAKEIEKVEHWCYGKTMPLMRVLADAQRLGYPIVRLKQIIQEMSKRWDGALNGGRLLHHLHLQYTQASGSEEDQHLISLILRRAAIPYLAILKQYMREGVLRDPFNEFFVVENKWAVDDTDPGAAFDHRFIYKKEMVPGFINKDRMAKMAYVAGQYCCLLRECTGALPPIAAYTEHEPLVWTDAEDLQAIVQKYYDSACGAVISLLFDSKNDIIGKLTSLKKYFLHARGDWLVDFLDAADDAFRKSPTHVKGHTIRILLQTAIAKSSSHSDPYHSSISCSFSDFSLDTFVDLMRRGQPTEQGQNRGKVETQRCAELLQLDVLYHWPATLVITPVVVQHFNCIFRLLLRIKVTERKLHDAWWLDRSNVSSPLTFSLKQQMVHFLRQFQFYASHFVLERLWEKMILKLRQSDSVFTISQTLEGFFKAADQELVLSNPERFNSLNKILELMENFSILGYSTNLNRGSGRKPSSTTVNKLNKQIKQIGEDFWKGLADLADPRGADYPHLLPLFTWIDFSRYFESRNVFKVVHSAAAKEEVDQMSFNQLNSRKERVVGNSLSAITVATQQQHQSTNQKNIEDEGLDEYQEEDECEDG